MNGKHTALLMVAIAAVLAVPVLIPPSYAQNVPGAVNNVSVASHGQDYVVLTLEAPTGDYNHTDYDILYIPTNCGDGAVLFTTSFGAQACRFEGETSSTGLTQIVTGLAAGSSYTFYPLAENAAGDGPLLWNAGQTTATTSSAPGTPTALAAGTATASSIQLSWTAPSSNGGAWITDYVVQYKLNTATSWTTFADGTSQATGTTVTGLTAGTSYDFQIAAKNTSGTVLIRHEF